MNSVRLVLLACIPPTLAAALTIILGFSFTIFSLVSSNENKFVSFLVDGTTSYPSSSLRILVTDFPTNPLLPKTNILIMRTPKSSSFKC